MKIQPTSDYHEDYGYCLFFHFDNFEEPPKICCDAPTSIGFDEKYWTHFTRNFDFNEALKQAEKLSANGGTVKSEKCLKLTQQHLKKHPEKLSRFSRVKIFSKEWGAWWRHGGAGYTTDPKQAGIFTAEDGWKAVSHCGPEKKIELHEA